MNITNIVTWIVVGAVAGWLAGKVIRGYSFGLIESIIIGLVGAFLGGWLFNTLGIHIFSGIIGTVLVAFCGSAVLLIAVRFLRSV